MADRQSTMRIDPETAARIANDNALWSDFEAICNCGGRLAGTQSERQAFELVERLGRDAAGGIVGQRIGVPYEGWSVVRSSLHLDDGTSAECYPLLRSTATPAQGLNAEVIDLGRGALEDFAAQASDIPGRITLVRHELMFAAGTIHRGRKYEMARDYGAVGFLIAGPLEEAIVAGSSGRQGPEGIPSAGISPQTAGLLAGRSTGRASVTLTIETLEAPAEAQNLVFDVPGQSDETVLLSAHLDGHEVSESAMDNGSGLAVVLAVLRCLAPEMRNFKRGLRVAFFNVEEWALTGSAHYVGRLDQRARDSIALNINLDSVGGSSNLTALTSGFPALGPYLQEVATSNGINLQCHLPLMMNSDHANFAAAGIPAFRLVAGFDEPDANLRHVLTPADTRDKVTPGELHQAVLLTAAIVVAACNAGSEEVTGWRAKTTE